MDWTFVSLLRHTVIYSLSVTFFALLVLPEDLIPMSLVHPLAVNFPLSASPSHSQFLYIHDQKHLMCLFFTDTFTPKAASQLFHFWPLSRSSSIGYPLHHALFSMLQYLLLTKFHFAVIIQITTEHNRFSHLAQRTVVTWYPHYLSFQNICMYDFPHK